MSYPTLQGISGIIHHCGKMSFRQNKHDDLRRRSQLLHVEVLYLKSVQGASSPQIPKVSQEDFQDGICNQLLLNIL